MKRRYRWGVKSKMHHDSAWVWASSVHTFARHQLPSRSCANAAVRDLVRCGYFMAKAVRIPLKPKPPAEDKLEKAIELVRGAEDDAADAMKACISTGSYWNARYHEGYAAGAGEVAVQLERLR